MAQNKINFFGTSWMSYIYPNIACCFFCDFHLTPVDCGQALTGTCYPTLPGFFFTTRTLTRIFFKISGFRVVTPHAVFCLELMIISMMPANQFRRKGNSLKIVKIDINESITNTSSIHNSYGLILHLVMSFIKVTWSSVGRVRFSWVIFSWLRLSAQIGPEPTSDKNSQTGHRMIF